jgi:hypothetical protein
MAYLVDGDPVFDPVSQPFKEDLGVIYEIPDYLLTDESAIFLLES